MVTYAHEKFAGTKKLERFLENHCNSLSDDIDSVHVWSIYNRLLLDVAESYIEVSIPLGCTLRVKTFSVATFLCLGPHFVLNSFRK